MSEEEIKLDGGYVPMMVYVLVFFFVIRFFLERWIIEVFVKEYILENSKARSFDIPTEIMKSRKMTATFMRGFLKTFLLVVFGGGSFILYFFFRYESVPDLFGFVIHSTYLLNAYYVCEMFYLFDSMKLNTIIHHSFAFLGTLLVFSFVPLLPIESSESHYYNRIWRGYFVTYIVVNGGEGIFNFFMFFESLERMNSSNSQWLFKFNIIVVCSELLFKGFGVLVLLDIGKTFFSEPSFSWFHKGFSGLCVVAIIYAELNVPYFAYSVLKKKMKKKKQ